MLFSSIAFLYFFLPVFMIGYGLAPPRWKNLVLLAFSLAFYFWGEPIYTLLLLAVTGLSFVFGKMIATSAKKRTAGRWLAASVIVSLSALVFFKYADFFVGILNSAFGTHVPLLKLSLPLGISFYVFRTMSYTIDIYRGLAPVQNSPVSYAAYATMFPQLLAGPIVRYSTVAEAMEHRHYTVQDVAQGIFRFTIGLAKKVLIANQLSELNQIAHTSAEG